MSESRDAGQGERSRPASDRFRLRRGVKALVTGGERVLLIRERHADGAPFWTLPGGGVHLGEAPARALRRELREELRCRCTVDDPVGSFPYVHTGRSGTVSLYSVRECWLRTEPRPAASEGVTAITWAEPGSLPDRTLPQVRALVRDLYPDGGQRGTAPSGGRPPEATSRTRERRATGDTPGVERE